ncbi:interferon-inducible GTPase 5-like [Malaclemys terrapin pileata]|uniref:interferon-inducible GTPase 5-like n=1 Tax=Malaclemys terrapin pileata TaxID=2991368 RepID=UPI0023A8FD89|nr:interferon-inducible GTPase 5-like [Malaclemys terrapin pileata]
MEDLSALTKGIDIESDPKGFFNAALQVYEKFVELFKDGGQEEAASKAQEDLESLENTKINIAVTGQTGSGKSSFINALHGLGAEDQGAAQTGVIETTTEATAYPHPSYPNVILWDLPGIGGMDFRPERYLQQVNFRRYDFFVIVASERFRSSHADLAREIQRMEKKFYFVRCKVDEDLANARRAHPQAYVEENVLQRIRENARKCLRDQGVIDPQVFLLSNWDLDQYDFPLLEETLEKDLPHLQRLVFLLSLPNFSPEIIEKKKSALHGHLWKISLVSAFINVLPMGGVSLACDVGLLLVSMIAFYKQFNLDDDSLAKLARQAGKPVAELKAVIVSPQGEVLTQDVLKKKIVQVGCGLTRSVERCFDLVPVLSTLAAAGLSFAMSYSILSNFLEKVAEDARRVRKKVLE